MLRSVAAVAGLMLLSGAAAPSGEKPGLLTADNNRVRWEQAQQYAARASLVVLGRVVEAGPEVIRRRPPPSALPRQ